MTITLNRPDKKNAITMDMWAELARLFDDIATSQDDRVLVITGAGDAFCSGADLSGAADGPTGNGLVPDAAVGAGRAPSPRAARSRRSPR